MGCQLLHVLCQQVLSVTCSPLRWHARRCCARAGPYPDCRVQVCLGPTSALKSQGQLPLSLHHRGGCTGPLAADLSNRTRRAVGAKDARTTRTPPGLRRGQVGTALTVGVADGKAGGPRRSQTGTAGLSVPGHAGRRAAPRNADCNSQMTADCNSSGMRTVIRSERITVRRFELPGWFWISVMYGIHTSTAQLGGATRNASTGRRSTCTII